MPKGIYRLLMLLSLIFSTSAASALTANFTADAVAGCAPLVVHFTNTSSGATSYYWDLGNGTNSTLTDVSGSYVTPGTYTCVLTAYNGSSSTTHSITITVYPSPTVSFFASDTAICPGTGVTFTSTSSPGVAGAVTNLWNFGDGTLVTGASPTHAYITPGYYNVTLVVTNSMGCSSSLTLSLYIHVYSRPTVSFGAPIVGFCHAPGTVNFTNSSGGAAPLTYSWSFGDGGTSSAATPGHTYSSAGVYTVKLVVTDGNGCMDSFVRVNYVYVGTVTTSFTGPDTVCLNSIATFRNTSSTHISSTWSFGDGGTATTDTGYHAYTAPGTYSVRLIIFNGYCYDTVIHSIVVLPHATASFTWAPTDPCPAPAAIHFTSTAPAGSTITWLYGDGTTGTGASPTHTYAGNGFDTVKMIVTNSHGCADTVTQIISIYDLYLDILADTISGCAPLTVNFVPYLKSYHPVYGPYPWAGVSYSWSFGDGGTSTSATPSYTYTTPGVYTATCTVVTANGCTVTGTFVIRVGEPPVVTFTGSPMHICYGDSVRFVATVVSGSVDTYYWVFGDGSAATTGSSTTTHYYLYPGYFTVTLVGYNRGCPSAPYAVDTFIVDSPAARAAITYLCTPYNSVRFYDSSMGDDSHIWIFGDGTTSGADSVTHIFPPLSIDTIHLATYNATSGCRDTTEVIVNLIPPVLSMAADDSAVCQGTMITFTPTVTGGSATAYYWWVNGVLLDNDTGMVFRDTFNIPGHYTIKLGVLDGHRCLDTVAIANWITVAQPIDSFVATPVNGCAPLVVNFTDYTTDVSGVALTNYTWRFGDGTSATTTTGTVAHTYTAAGVYSVFASVTDIVGCSDSVARPSYITVWKPHAVFSASTLFPCIGATCHFNNASSGISGSLWFFGDGDTSTANAPNHVYRAVGSYTVRLVVYDSHGCPDTATYVNYISVTRPVASFYMDDSFTICPPLPVHFYNTSTGATTYSWDFGDGGTSVIASPGDLYTAPGTYTVTLVAVNSHGCRDTAYGHAIVYGYAGAFSYGPLQGCAPLLVHFSASLSNIPNIVWDFADGNTSSTSYSDTASHYYVNPGTYVPKLILSDSTGCQNSSIGLDTIKVGGIRPGFTSLPHPVCVNTTVTFLDTSFSYFSHDTAWLWVFAPGDTSFVSSPSYHYSVTGTYPVTLTVTDGWGCTGTITENVIVNPPPHIYTSPDTTICVSDTAALHAFGGVSYNWSPAAVLGCASCQTAFATPVVITTYTVTGTDTNGCVSSDTVTVYMRTTTESRAWGDTAVCRNVSVRLFDTGGTKYTWLPSAFLDNSHVFNPIATPTSTTTYTVIAQLGSCLPDTNFVSVVVHQLPTVDAGPDQWLIVGQHAQLQATGTLISAYEWTPAALLSCDSCANPVSSAVHSTTYVVTVWSDYGCRVSDSVNIYFTCAAGQLFIPNTFTPNGDGQNDVFYPRGGGVSSIKAFRIYNRWGELLFEKENFQVNDKASGWDGIYQGQVARPDVYVYLVEAVCATGEMLFIKGDVTLIK